MPCQHFNGEWWKCVCVCKCLPTHTYATAGIDTIEKQQQHNTNNWWKIMRKRCLLLLFEFFFYFFFFGIFLVHKIKIELNFTLIRLLKTWTWWWENKNKIEKKNCASILGTLPSFTSKYAWRFFLFRIFVISHDDQSLKKYFKAGLYRYTEYVRLRMKMMVSYCFCCCFFY